MPTGIYWKMGLYIDGLSFIKGQYIALLKYNGKLRVKYEDEHPEAPKIVPRVEIVR